MMQSFSFLVRSYCGACILAGVLQQFFVSDTGKRCIRGVTGLYMAASLVLCLHQLPGLPLPSRQAVPAQQQTETLYTAQMLAGTRQQLETACDRILQGQGMFGGAQVELAVTPQGEIRVACITLTGPPHPEVEALLSIFAAEEIRWRAGETNG